MKYGAITSLILAAALTCGLHAELTQVVVKQGDVYISGVRILLPDVADYLNVEPDTKAKLDELYIKRAALPGNRLVLSRNYIESKVIKQFPGIKVTGAETINVWSSKASVPRADIEKTARDFILENMPWKPEDVQIKVKEISGTVAVLDGEVLLKVIEGETVKFKGNVVVPVAIFVDGRQYRIEPVSMVIRVFAPVAVAAADIGRGAQPDVSFVSMERNDVTFLPEGIITDSSWLNGKAAKRAVQKGVILTKDMFEFIPLFRRGSVVPVVARIRAVSVETRGVAQSDGRPYDTVRVKLDNGKMIEGRVDENGKVIIEK
ncbi:MAG: flagellar basal body P-ring formation chaperone FlgA [Spirochaetia bacterium]|nr:flagellar basal body P-ring formation chaperone FlgA [Spirochaetia bacterium]